MATVLVTCADGPPTPSQHGSLGSRWWPPIWPSRSVPACHPGWPTPGVSPIRSTSCGSPTAVSIKSGGGCRTRRWAIVAARRIRCIGSASCCSPAPNASINAAPNGCCSDCASATPMTRRSVPGSPRRVSVTCTSPTPPRTPRRCWTKRSLVASPTRSPRSARSQDAQGVAQRDPRPPRHRSLERADRRLEPVRQEGQALRARLPLLRQLPAPRAASRRRRHLARTTPPTTHQNPPSPLRRVEPVATATRSLLDVLQAQHWLVWKARNEQNAVIDSDLDDYNQAAKKG